MYIYSSITKKPAIVSDCVLPRFDIYSFLLLEKTLIVFSHDFYDEGINNLVNSVDFAKTMQIFYPYSIQTHPKEFPGESPNDCPRNAKKDQ